MGDATGPGCSEVGGAKTVACVDDAGTIDDDGPRGMKGEVDIVVREKQTHAKKTKPRQRQTRPIRHLH